MEVLDEDPLRQVESTLLQRQMEHQPRQDQESSINEFLRSSIHRLTGIRGHSYIAVRGGGDQPWCYPKVNMVSRVVYYVLRSGGGGQIMVRMVLRNL